MGVICVMGLGQCLAYSKASVRVILIVEGREFHDQADISSHPTSTTPSRSPPSRRQLRHHLSSREKPLGDSSLGALDR